MDEEKLKPLIDRYFSTPERQMLLEAGTVLIEQGGNNERLYYVRSGKLAGFYSEAEESEEGSESTQVLSAGTGEFVGVHSFFSGTWTASSTVIAQVDSQLAWIERADTESPDDYSALTAQFMPLIVNELSQRQIRAMRESLAKEKALQQLYTAEQMTTLGQLAAGIAHELNNATGVVSSKAVRLEAAISSLINQANPELATFFETGLIQGQVLTSREVRERGKTFEKTYRLPKDQARELARAIPREGHIETWMKQHDVAIRAWQLGRDLYDLKLASQHTVGIVKSVKQLGRTEISHDEVININDTIMQAKALLKSDLRGVSVHFEPGTLPAFTGSQTELMQMWINILKNACDALKSTIAPEIHIHTRYSNGWYYVTIGNNGPEITEETRRKIFQPDFTTKKTGLSFGLGLGLSIVKRIASNYNGSVAVKSDREKTIFRIRLAPWNSNE
ncbi:ATP-binding protein [Sansalvadorimonas verongulae]|uniref:ATP-binding protein n=1 Tax=Sansalvadorimonas verongulae TaxID=2172824 RepID=UPI0012BCFC57|nr:ATP-binding protein [Sansalvadorimonas verongulae]MTI14368.1 cyclic nucleotide-binding domain-containing protein [Sansalvadorimonas verongulae]